MSDPYLQSFQAAFRSELEKVVQNHCVGPAVRILDCPCGDGFYAGLFAQNLPRGSAIVGVDASTQCLDRAVQNVRGSNEVQMEFSQASAYELPFDDNSFDVVWCAQSFITLDTPVLALKEFARVIKPHGKVIVLETDEFHHILLPWPVTLELAVLRAVRAESRVRYGTSEKFAQARKLSSFFLEAGLALTGRTTLVADRTAPLQDSLRTFLIHHFTYLQDFVRAELTGREFDQLQQYLSDTEDEGFLNRPDSYLTCLASICTGGRR